MKIEKRTGSEEGEKEQRDTHRLKCFERPGLGRRHRGVYWRRMVSHERNYIEMQEWVQRNPQSQVASGRKKSGVQRVGMK